MCAAIVQVVCLDARHVVGCDDSDIGGPDCLSRYMPGAGDFRVQFCLVESFKPVVETRRKSRRRRVTVKEICTYSRYGIGPSMTHRERLLGSPMTVVNESLFGAVAGQ